MTYRVVDVDGQLDAWLDDDSNADQRQALLEWLAKLAEDPMSVEGEPIPNWMDLPTWTTAAPGTQARVSWAVLACPPFAREYECVAIITVRNA